MEFTAKTVEEAVKQGLEQLNITQEQAEIVIKEEPTKGLFGRLKGNAVVEITVKQTSNEENAVKLVENVLKFLDIEAQATLSTKEEKTIITLTTSDSSALIGYRGEVLDALQVIAGAMANMGNKEYKKIVVDCENYRDKREETLIKLAHKLEAKATEIRREVMLEPMTPFERRIIHTALAQSTTVTTTSQGKEPNRYIVIVPNDKDEFAKPYNAGRNNDKKGGKNFKNNRGDKKSFNKRGGNGYKRSSGFSDAPRKKSSSFSFGTYLGNSFKDND